MNATWDLSKFSIHFSNSVIFFYLGDVGMNVRKPDSENWVDNYELGNVWEILISGAHGCSGPTRNWGDFSILDYTFGKIDCCRV